MQAATVVKLLDKKLTCVDPFALERLGWLGTRRHEEAERREVRAVHSQPLLRD